ncbi:S1 family peptidase [Streptomyces kaniharaensis]|nr:S1 family peptidase [Streptomyces kaniharaensis]
MKRTVVGAVVVALTVLSAAPAQSASGGGKGNETVRAIAAQDNTAAPDWAAEDKVPASSASRAALAMIQERIAGYVASHGTAHTFGSYLDPATDRIVLDTDAPANVVAMLTDLSGTESALVQAAGKVQVRPRTTTDAFNRRDDSPPFWGGAGIQSGGALCSTGYAVANGSGTRFTVTAGHCFSTGSTVTTESGAYTVGSVSNRHLPTVTGEPVDMEAIGGQSYAGRIYTGGVYSSTSIPVVAAGTAYVGYSDYCHSGRTTGEQCGHTATSINGQVCTQTGCKSPVIVYTGGVIQQGGDSGGTFYAKNASGAWIRGHVIASNSTTGYVEPWTVVAPTLGVSIVTG